MCYFDKALRVNFHHAMPPPHICGIQYTFCVIEHMALFSSSLSLARRKVLFGCFCFLSVCLFFEYSIYVNRLIRLVPEYA